MILSFIYYLIPFVEERLHTTQFIMIIISIINIFLSVLLIICHFPWYTWTTTLFSNLTWFIVLRFSFPYITIKNPLIYIGAVFSFLSHISWLISLVFHPLSAFATVSIYVLLVLITPLYIIINLSASEGSETYVKSSINQKIVDLRDMIPHSGFKKKNESVEPTKN